MSSDKTILKNLKNIEKFLNEGHYEDRKKHNRIILKKLNKLIKKQEEIN